MYPANGRFNGQAALTASLTDNRFRDNQQFGDPSYPYQWRTVMELTPGVHQLKVAAAIRAAFHRMGDQHIHQQLCQERLPSA